MKIIVTVIPTDLVTNLLKARIWFSPSWWSGNKNISVFCLQWVQLYFKVMPNSRDFYKGIFLHVVPVRIIVPWVYWVEISTWFSQTEMKSQPRMKISIFPYNRHFFQPGMKFWYYAYANSKFEEFKSSI